MSAFCRFADLRVTAWLSQFDSTETFVAKFAVTHNAVFPTRCGRVQFSEMRRREFRRAHPCPATLVRAETTSRRYRHERCQPENLFQRLRSRQQG
jgi:hypothetical protein